MFFPQEIFIEDMEPQQAGETRSEFSGEGCGVVEDPHELDAEFFDDNALEEFYFDLCRNQWGPMNTDTQMHFEVFIGRGGTTVQLQELLEENGAAELRPIDVFELMFPSRLMVFISQQINNFVCRNMQQNSALLVLMK